MSEINLEFRYIVKYDFIFYEWHMSWLYDYKANQDADHRKKMALSKIKKC
ncbi:unknown protein [Simkania negevensis Z]|uniref:Uncharacterized protein n=1 Tax=Simkania negevensis (strain ATCC VR-1471 / DSM 27360 / Z) TaxID=331113 RepID=F8L4Q3_SIMNZ|nr:unknown protein [Simkania negevensis Z]